MGKEVGYVTAWRERGERERELVEGWSWMFRVRGTKENVYMMEKIENMQ